MKRSRSLRVLCGALLAIGLAAPTVAPAASSGPAAPQTRQIKQPTLDIQPFTLKNGLRVYVVEQHHAPVVTVNVTYNVGSRDERPGRTGFAHLFEHMMFQGSANVGKAEHFKLINDYGGVMNGSTSFDRTNYFQTMPAHQLEMMLFLEADRMRSLDVSQANLDNQRNAVQEERRLRYDNRPYGLRFEKLWDTCFDNFAYKHSTIGSMADLNAATLEDVTSFFKTYYAPNNAALIIVGDVKLADAKKLVEKYFGDIPSATLPPLPDLTEKLDKGERVVSYEDKLAPEEDVSLAYPSVIGNHPDYFALELATMILGGSESSRLYQRLIKREESASQTFAGIFQLRGPSPVVMAATAVGGKKASDLLKAIDEEIVKMQTEKVSSEELSRVKTAARASLVSELETSLYLSVRLGENAVYFGDPGFISKMAGMYDAVTAEDIQRVMNTYVKPSNRAVVYTLPAAKPAPAAEPAPVAPAPAPAPAPTPAPAGKKK